MDRFLLEFETVFMGLRMFLWSYVSRTMYVLLGLQLAWMGIQIAVGELQDFGKILMKGLGLFFIVWFISNFQMLALRFSAGFSGIIEGLYDDAFGVRFGSPNYLWEQVQRGIFQPITDMRPSTGTIFAAFRDADLLFMYGLIWVILVICFAIIILQLVVAVLEWNIILIVGQILLPFTLFKPTEFIGGKVISAVVGEAIKLGIINFTALLTITTFITYVEQNPHQLDSLEGMAAIITIAMISAFLNVQAPALATSLLSGIPNLSASSFMQNVSGMVMTIRSGTRLLTNSLGAGKDFLGGALGGKGGGGGGGGGGGMARTAGAATGVAAGAAFRLANKAGSAVGSTVGRGMGAIGNAVRGGGGGSSPRANPVRNAAEAVGERQANRSFSSTSGGNKA